MKGYKMYRYIRLKAFVLLLVMLAETFAPISAWALTGGPSQPEVQSFEPVGTSEMVDVFSGDFNYNIPLLDVNGYPINIAYHAGASMDEEASWVGLGWNINPGTINRSLNGLPDDMKGEDVTKELQIKPNRTIGLSVKLKDEVFGYDRSKNKKLDSFTVNFGIRYNNYKGMGYDFGFDGKFSSKASDATQKLGLNSGLNLNLSDDGGLTVSPNISIQNKDEKSKSEGRNRFTIGTSFNSREGLYSYSMGVNHSTSELKKNDKSRKWQSNSGITYTNNNTHYTPGISTPMNVASVNLNFKPGGIEIFGIHGVGELSGFYTSQYIPDRCSTITKKGYGYLYEQEADEIDKLKDGDYLLDFSRDNDNGLAKHTPYLGWVNHQFDMYNVAAQGIGGTYRLHRNDVPILHDDFRKTQSNGYTAGYEIGNGKDIKAGINLGYNHTGNQSGMWIKGNKLKDRIGFKSRSLVNANIYNPQYEPVYFREVNELIPQNDQYLNLVGGDRNVQPALNGLDLGNYLKGMNGQAGVTYNSNHKENIAKDRTIRNKLMKYVLAGESHFCLNHNIESYSLNSKVYSDGKLVSTPISRYDGPEGNRKANHISEVSVVNSDGSRHVFGIPAYNYKQIEKNFRVNNPEYSDKQKGIIVYGAGENSFDNKNQLDYYYSSTTTPAYAHSYLLTGVLSPDYIDLTGDGISDDDFGSAVKINYLRKDSTYKWRSPYTANSARYNEGIKSDQTDNMGSYVYGEKEVWYMHSIEGKTHIALFTLSVRNDGLGVLGEQGGKDTMSRLYKVDRIELFSKRELKELGSAAIPIKSVHFVYDYSLCKGVENQVNTANGKLTLKEIYFTYGKSQKGKFNSYKFSYHDNATATYHMNAYDRWGTYAPPRNETDTDPNNSQYPYTTQNQEDADEFAAMWNLEKIELPSGGEINVEYESDDYAYVQDQRAMRMLKIKNFGRWNKKEDGFERESKLYSDGVLMRDNDLIFFELEEQLPLNNEGKRILKEEYLSGIDQLQVTLDLEIHKGNREYIKSYVYPIMSDSTKDYGVTDDGNTGWVRVALVDIEEKENKAQLQKVNPLAKAAWQYTRLNLNHIVNPFSDKKKSGAHTLPAISLLISFVQEMANFAAGPNQVLMARGFCQNFNPNKSWVRLNDPNKKKIGGGHRIKKISMNDKWETLNHKDPNATASNYGQEYSYTIQADSTLRNYSEISSGVASYEPGMGRDENPFIQPEYYDQKRKGVPDIKHTFEHPIGESFFPGASVGYSKVTVKSLSHDNQNVMHRTGSQVTEFYTYKDFPTKVTPAKIQSKFFEPPIGFNLFSFGASYKAGAAAQGFNIELNDMHGKPKANWSFDEKGNKLSGVEYLYQLNADGTLDNTVLAIQPDGTIANKEFGVNVDFAMDTRFNRENFYSIDAEVNLDISVPIAVASIYPSVNFSRTVTKTASSTKIVRKSGLLKKTIAYKEGSKIYTENLLYDGKTGDVLLTSVGNEFKDKVYNFNYPAHWAYDKGMGQAFQNWGIEVKNFLFYQGNLVGVGHDLNNFLVPGDKCLLNAGKITNKVVWVNTSTDGNLILIDENGKLVDQTGGFYKWDGTLRILESGRKNMANVSIGSVTCMKNPLVSDGGGGYTLEFSEVLATSAVEYKDHWKTDIDLIPRYVCDTIPTELYKQTISTIKEILSDSAFFNTYFYLESNWCLNAETLTKDSFDLATALFIHNSKSPIDLVSGFSVFNQYIKYLELDTFSVYTDDTINVYSYCSYPFNPSLFRKSGATYTNVLYSDFNSSLMRFPMDLTDSLYMFDSISSQYVKAYDIDIFNQFPSHVQRRNKLNVQTLVNYTVGATSTRLDSLYNSSKLPGDSCPLTPNPKYLAMQYEGMTDFVLNLRAGNCEGSCNTKISTNGKLVQNVLEIIEDEPVSNNQAILTARVKLQTGEIDTIPLFLTSECGNYLDCQYSCLTEAQALRVNPFLTGIRGNWRPYKSWTYLEDRNYSTSGSRPKTDGKFASYSNFWNFSDSSDKYEPNHTEQKWVWTSEVTEYSPFGMELENMDPLGRYSAALYGYAQTLPIAVASNSRHRQIWFEGFEEYTYLTTIMDEYICPPWMYPYDKDSTMDLMAAEGTPYLDHTMSHSGNVSLKLTSAVNLTQETALYQTWVNNVPNIKEGKEYITSQEDEIIDFRPTPGTYVYSGWINETSTPKDTIHDSTYIVLEFENGSGVFKRDTLRPKGLIIEGWQRIEQYVVIPSETIILRTIYKTEAVNGWFDDLRVFPYNGSMKSYAYDFRTLRLMAEMDENNYATFYEYDLEGNLIRIKKETERGVKTLQESRQHQKSNK